MMSILIGIHVFAIFLIIYHHILYPMLLTVMTNGKLEDHSASMPIIDETQLPEITMVIPAYNEETWIRAKLINITMLDYPKDKLHVLVMCDGCTDNTYDAAVEYLQNPECADLKIQVVNCEENRGKVAVINDAMTRVTTDIVAMSDVSAIISIDALKLAAHALQAPQVGAINSKYQIYDKGTSVDSSYWEYQSQIKQKESLLGSTLGAHGAFYIFRRELFTPLDADTINDDFIIPMQIIAKGFQVKQLSQINALELEATDSSMDGARRKRISAGNIQQVLRLKALMMPKHRYVAFVFLSGKGLRIAIPFLLIVIYLTNAFLLATHQMFVYEFIIQNLLYGLMFFDLRYEIKTNNKVFKLLSYAFRGHLNSFLGALDYVVHQGKVPWKKVN